MDAEEITAMTDKIVEQVEHVAREVEYLTAANREQAAMADGVEDSVAELTESRITTDGGQPLHTGPWSGSRVDGRSKRTEQENPGWTLDPSTDSPRSASPLRRAMGRRSATRPRSSSQTRPSRQCVSKQEHRPRR